MLTDTHAHLTAFSLIGDMEALLARAETAGVGRITAIGCDVASSRLGLELAERFPQVHATVGLHPTYVTEEPAADWLEQLTAMARHPRCVGIGETGLDFYHPAPEGWTWEAYTQRQRECFAAQLALAADCGKNVIVHQRDRTGTACWDAIKEMIGPWHGRLRAVFHCWLHAWPEAAPMVAQGHLISFTGIATYKSAPEVAACAAEAPAGSFMLETDSPYLAPVPHRGQRNEPAFLRATADRIAALRGISTGELAALTTQTADAFFGWNDTLATHPLPSHA
jgi:TatD DNase family protein